jgi:V/A-type H+-transporting ATPase subunit I
MSIVSLTKVTLFGSRTEQKATLQELQSLGCMHLISDQKELRPVEFTPLTREESAFEALRYLTAAPRRRHQVIDEDDFNPEQVVAAALQNQKRQRTAIDQKISLAHRINEVTPWGNFVLPPAEELGGYKLWFYRVPHRERRKLETLAETWEVVSTDQRHLYVVVISKEEPPQNLLPVPRSHLGGVPLSELKRSLQRLELEIEDLVAERNALSRWTYLLSQHLARVEDQQALEQAVQQARQVEDMFVVQGWLPVTHIPAVQILAQTKGLALLREDPGPEEKPPTLLENPPAFQGGQGLVTFYETPGYRAWDPSVVTIFSFAVFFAMILADAGYALVLAIPLFWSWKRLGQSAGGKRFRTLTALVLGTSFVYGILCGSYFGIEPSRGSLLGAFHWIHLQDLTSMMQLSLIIGCLHLILANAASSFHARSLPRKVRPIGWIALIVGGLLLFLSKGSVTQPAIQKVGIVALVIGCVVLVCFGSDQAVTSFKTGLLRVLGGFASLFDITKLFGDTLSYLRLFALGLASASLAITFNQIAGQVRQGVPGLGVLLALLILLLGHALNLSLGIVSGVVHGLRLNYIEFFNWSISEEGHPFRAFGKKETPK